MRELMRLLNVAIPTVLSLVTLAAALGPARARSRPTPRRRQALWFALPRSP